MAALPGVIYTSSKADEEFLEALREDIAPAATGSDAPGKVTSHNSVTAFLSGTRGCTGGHRVRGHRHRPAGQGTYYLTMPPITSSSVSADGRLLRLGLEALLSE